MTSNQNIKIKIFYLVLFYQRENDLLFEKKVYFFFDKTFTATPMIEIKKKFRMIESVLLIYVVFNNCNLVLNMEQVTHFMVSLICALRHFE